MPTTALVPQLFKRLRQNYLRTFSRVALLLTTTLVSLLSCPLPAYAVPGDSPQQQVLAQEKKIDQRIVQPCKAEREQKAAPMRASIASCDCTDAVKQQETEELEAILQKEMRRCEQKGTDALNQFKQALITQAQDDFTRYSGQVELDRQILKNIGFNRTVDEMESWTQYGQEAQKKYTQEARNEVLSKFFQSVHLKAEGWAAPPQMTTTKAVSLINLFKATGVKDKALFNALRSAALGESQIPERMLWVKITGTLEKLNEGREVLQTEHDAVSIFNSLLNVASWMTPEIVPYVSIVKDATWIGYATYTHVKVAYGLNDVNRLTTLTEAQLKDLEPVTRRLKQDVDGLVAAKRVLQWAAETGNNTHMVR